MSQVIWKRIMIAMLPVLLSMAAPAAHGQDTEVDQKSKQVFGQFLDYVNGLETFSVQVTHNIIRQEVGLITYRAEVYDVAIARPRRLVMKLNKGTLGATVVCDAQNVYTYLPTLQQYTVKSAPATLPPLFWDAWAGRVLESTIPLLNLMISKDYFSKFLEGITWGKYLGTETIENVACHHIEIIHSGLTWGIWISQGDKPLIRKIVPDLTPFNQPQNPYSGAPMMEVKIDWHFRNWQVDSKIEDDIFTFKPPIAATKVSRFVEESSNHYLIGKKAPEFTLDLLDGSKLKLAEHLGKDVIILDFWAIYCPPCRAALPILQRVAEKYKDKGLVFCAINGSEPASHIRNFLKQLDLNIPVGLDHQSRVSSLYHVKYLPQTVVIGKNGKIAKVHIGLPSNGDEILSREVEILLAEKPNAPKPDLICKKVVFSPAQIKTGNKFSFAYTIANAGRTPSDEAGYQIKLLIDNKEVYSTFVTEVIQPGAEATFSVSPDIWYLQPTTPGTHQYSLIIDPTNRIAELNEDNNTHKGTFEVKE